MTRRHKIALLGLIGFPLLFIGLGAQAEEPWREPSAEMCTSDLMSVFDWCEAGGQSECKYIARPFADACQAGCVLRLCPEQAKCTGLDPIWCAPCSDAKGARYWLNNYEAHAHCDDLPKNGIQPLMDCLRTEMKTRCPQWNGVWERWDNDSAFDD